MCRTVVSWRPQQYLCSRRDARGRRVSDYGSQPLQVTDRDVAPRSVGLRIEVCEHRVVGLWERAVEGGSPFPICLASRGFRRRKVTEPHCGVASSSVPSSCASLISTRNRDSMPAALPRGKSSRYGRPHSHHGFSPAGPSRSGPVAVSASVMGSSTLMRRITLDCQLPRAAIDFVVLAPPRRTCPSRSSPDPHRDCAPVG